MIKTRHHCDSGQFQEVLGLCRKFFMALIVGPAGSSFDSPSTSIAPLDLKEFGSLHKVPHTPFSVKGKAYSPTEVLFHIYDKDGKELGNVKVKVSPNWQEDEERLETDDIHKNLHHRSLKPDFLSEGAYIRIQRLSISGTDERGLRKIAKSLLQTLMEFAKKMNAQNRIFGDLPFCATKRLHEVGMRYYSEERPTIEERADAGELHKHEIVTLYLPDDCAKQFNERIKKKPIFLT